MVQRLWKLLKEKEDLSGRVGWLVVDRSGVGMGFIAGTSIPEEAIFTPEHSLQKVRWIVGCGRYTTYPSKGANKILSSNTARYTSQKLVL